MFSTNEHSETIPSRPNSAAARRAAHCVQQHPNGADMVTGGTRVQRTKNFASPFAQTDIRRGCLKLRQRFLQALVVEEMSRSSMEGATHAQPSTDRRG